MDRQQRFYALPYRVLFHDTMAYGSHHHMLSLKLQNIARETIVFETRVDGREVWRDQLAGILMLTRECYSLNLAPVGLGDKVAVLMTYEEPSRSTVRLCFRILRSDGTPVACGFQTLVLVDETSHRPVPGPPMLTDWLDPESEYHIPESLVAPSFAERLVSGAVAVKQVFPPEIRALGERVAGAPPAEGFPKVVAIEGTAAGRAVPARARWVR